MSAEKPPTSLHAALALIELDWTAQCLPGSSSPPAGREGSSISPRSRKRASVDTGVSDDPALEVEGSALRTACTCRQQASDSRPSRAIASRRRGGAREAATAVRT